MGWDLELLVIVPQIGVDVKGRMLLRRFVLEVEEHAIVDPNNSVIGIVIASFDPNGELSESFDIQPWSTSLVVGVKYVSARNAGR